MLDYLMLVLISSLAVAMVIWYFRKRKEMIRFIKAIIDELEDVFKPVDKVYELLGYLIGFKAKYKLGRYSKALNAYVTLTTVPRHSLLYYPIAKAMSRKDMLGIAVEFREGVLREFHLVRYGSKRLGMRLRSDVHDIDRMKSKTVEVLGNHYVAYYYDDEVLDLVLDELGSYGLNVMQLSVFKSKNLIYVLVEAKEGVVREAHKLINSLYGKLVKKR